MKAFEVTYEKNVSSKLGEKPNTKIVHAEDFEAASRAIRDFDKDAFCCISSFVETTLKENIH